MQNKKEQHLLDKIIRKNYKNELEKILERKSFGENAKSLLLEILYKIEIAYKDYGVAKVDAKTKDEYIEDLIKVIEKNCKDIKIIKPNSDESKLLDGKSFKINKDNGQILCLPIARKLLYAISKIDKKTTIVNSRYYLLTTTLSDLINIGDNMNCVEPLRDFNGWSWTTVPEEFESIEYNLVYQILLILVGKEFIYDWIKNGDSILDYVEKLGEKLSELYEPELAKEIVSELKKLSILIHLNVDKDAYKELESAKLNIKSKLNKFDDKETYIKELTSEKNKLNRKIKRIDKIISNKELLQKEYVKRNAELSLEEKIFSIRILAEMMSKERAELFKEMKECNNLLMPQNFLARKTELRMELKILNLVDISNREKELKDKIKDFQKLFLECFKIKIKNAETRQDILNLINQFRYYCLLPFNTKEDIFNLKYIKGRIDTVAKGLIRKAIESRVMIEFADDEKLNYEIIKNIFSVRIANLEEASIKITKEKVGYYVQFFDEKTADKIFILDKDELNKKELKAKINKKYRVFEKNRR